MISLRPATMEDAPILLSWRNDPTTYMNFLVQKPVPPKRHDFWMQVNVRFGYPQRKVLMAEDEGELVGVIDFIARDPEMKTYEISITVAPHKRNKGYGAKILALGCINMRARTLIAEIRKENGASRKIFQKCGFTFVKGDKEFDLYRKEAI